jgi:hypothetical protein
MTCSPLKINQRFVGTYCFHLHGPINRAWYQHEGRWQAGILLSLYVCMYVCMYVWGVGFIRPSALRPSLIYCASPLISPLLIPHFKLNVWLYLWGRHKVTRFHEELAQVTKSQMSYSLTITQDMWLIHLLLGTFHKWDHPSIPVWKGVPLDDSVL